MQSYKLIYNNNNNDNNYYKKHCSNLLDVLDKRQENQLFYSKYTLLYNTERMYNPNYHTTVYDLTHITNTTMLAH